MSDVCSEAVVTTENDVSSEDSSGRQKRTATGNVNAKPKFFDSKRRNMEKGLSASHRDKIYMKMAKDELILKQTLINQLTAAIKPSKICPHQFNVWENQLKKVLNFWLVQWVIIKEKLAFLILLLIHKVIIIRSNTPYPLVQHNLMSTTQMYHLLKLIEHFHQHKTIPLLWNFMMDQLYLTYNICILLQVMKTI